jgi:hypothetical protein
VDERLETGSALALVGIAGHHQNGEAGMIARRRQRQRDPIHYRHADICEQKLECGLGARQRIERRRAVVGGHHLVAIERQRAGNEATNAFFILGDQNARHESLNGCRQPRRVG